MLQRSLRKALTHNLQSCGLFGDFWGTDFTRRNIISIINLVFFMFLVTVSAYFHMLDIYTVL